MEAAAIVAIMAFLGELVVLFLNCFKSRKLFSPLGEDKLPSLEILQLFSGMGVYGTGSHSKIILKSLIPLQQEGATLLDTLNVWPQFKSFILAAVFPHPHPHPPSCPCPCGALTPGYKARVERRL